MMNLTVTKDILGEMEPASRLCRKCGVHIFYDRFKRLPEFGPNLCDPCGDNYDAQLRENALTDIFNSLLEKSDIPVEYQDWSADYAHQCGSDQTLDWMRKHAKQSVYVYGTHGRGKTHTVAYCAYRMLEHTRRPMKYLNLGKWLSHMMSLKVAHASIDAELNRLYSFDLVVIDDLGKEKLTESKLEIIYNVIDMRERQKKQTWYTSNLSIDNLSERLDDNFGPAIVERIRRMVGDNICFVG